ncbi:protein of unknown function DUF1338 [Kalmanozyma brasiliensis GHG001]|uniref:2-oxoadipate dioxygenase/decarboxylase n=1 Tax=Kalmanozyma brasiliensis (strain GHG001) TaxID=1365824 RepID=V5EX04_KALBG|nr:protein of unknown function DUF1338 [Kalmanozyma brasiliensis GHG001]EST06904.1 protein of unknown function DUF1338 [Kalmanozyma brasiliensis GHG001]
MGLEHNSELSAGLPTMAPSFGKSPPSTLPSSSFLQSQSDDLPALSSAESSSSPSSSSSCTTSPSLTSTQLRTLLASSMSSMYRTEVPLYGDLLSIISTVNSSIISRDPTLISDDEISRLSVERHGAIRVGTASELTLLSRIFRIFGMHPVGYYDLWKDARLPIHATAFRPVTAQGLLKNPFRVFCSLLRMHLIANPSTRRLAEELLGKRKIVSTRCIELLHKAEESTVGSEGEVNGLTRDEAVEFVECVVPIFAWHPTSPATVDEYDRLAKTHPLVADIVSFRGPHINHLTPRTLDIDAVQRAMVEQGMDAKDVVEGPPKRDWAVLLRQTSFHALSEAVVFDGEVEGKHKARFGEIEARGMALTRKGARLYDELMVKVGEVKREMETSGERVDKEQCGGILEKVFRDGFPDTRDALLRQGLGWWAFEVRDARKAKAMWQDRKENVCGWLADLVDAGALDAEPITYEDFLPASAAGIFQSNLPQATQSQAGEAMAEVDEAEARKRLELAVGGIILDYSTLYSEQQRQSLVEVGEVLRVDVDEIVEAIERQCA